MLGPAARKIHRNTEAPIQKIDILCLEKPDLLKNV